MSRTIRTTLLGHLPPYHHAAAALHEAGYLDRYLTVPISSRPLPGSRLPGVGPLVERWNRTRVQPELRPVRVQRLWAAQSVAYAAQVVMDRNDPGRSLRVRSAAWDAEAMVRVGRHPEVFHFVHGLGLHAALVARRRGALLVCDVRAPHREAHLATTVPHLERYGVRYRMPNEAITERLDKELELADVLICSSEYSRRTYVERGYDPDRVHSVPLGFDASSFTPASDPPARFTVLFAGRERTRKGLADLAVALRTLGADDLVLITGRPDERTRAWFDGVVAEVEFLGEVPITDMPAVYRRASVLALPSFSEAFGMVVVEAMASALPVVVSDHTGAAQAVEDGVSGFVVPVGDTDALAERLIELRDDPARRSAMGEAACRAAPAYSWDRFRNRLVEVYAEAIVPLVTSTSRSNRSSRSAMLDRD